MKGFLKDMDLMKWVLVVCWALAAVLLVWWISLRRDLAEAGEALARAPRHVSEVAMVERQMRLLKEGQRRAGEWTIRDDNPVLYLQRVIGDYARIDAAAFTVDTGRPREVAQVRGAVDQEFTVDFGRDRRREDRQFLHRNTIWAIVYNAEALSPRIKLRTLHMRAREVAAAGGFERGGTPLPETLSDEWHLERLVFATREPARQPRRN